MKNFILFTILFLSFSSFAQERRIKIIDNDTREEIPFAHVSIKDLLTGKKNYTTSDVNGVFVVEGDSEYEVSISFMGYVTLKEKVKNSSNYTISLKPDIYALDQVIVTGQQKPMLRDSSIYQVQVFDSKLIQQRGAVNLGDVLKAQPSIKIRQTGSFGSNINILGLGGENVKIMIDGVPVIGRLDGNLDLSQITMENVDHIEVIEGPMSVIYGSNALAGTINIITKDNKWNKYQFSANTYVESPATFNADVFASGKIGKSTLSGSLARNYFNGVSRGDSRESQWKGSEQYNAELRYTYYGNSYTFKVNGKYFDEFMKDKGAVDMINITATDVNFMTKRYSANTFLDMEHNDKMQTNVQASISYYDRVMQTVRKDMSDLSERQLDSDTTSFLNYMTRATFNHDINTNINYQTGIDINSEIGSAKRIQGGSQTISDYAVFFTSKIKVLENWTLQPGLRYAYNSMFSTPLLYSLNIKGELYDAFQFRASYAKGFRAPTLKEMFLDFAHAGINVIGNPDLMPESANTYNASLLYTLRDENNYKFTSEVKAFYNDTYDMIDFVRVDDINGTETWQNVNRGDIETLGFIIDLNYDLSDWLSVNANFARGGITSLEYINGNDVDKFIYSNNFLSAITYRIPKYSFTSRFEYAYNGEEPARFVDTESLVEPMVEAYHDLNFTVTKSFWLNKLNLSAGVKNILNNKDLNYQGVNEELETARLLSWGRSYFVKLNLQLK